MTDVEACVACRQHVYVDEIGSCERCGKQGLCAGCSDFSGHKCGATQWRVHTDALVEQFRNALSMEPQMYECDCGCENVMLYGKDARALWVCSNITVDPAKVVIVGLTTRSEFDAFMRDVQARLTANKGPQHTFNDLWARLRPLAPTA